MRANNRSKRNNLTHFTPLLNWRHTSQPNFAWNGTFNLFCERTVLEQHRVYFKSPLPLLSVHTFTPFATGRVRRPLLQESWENKPNVLGSLGPIHLAFFFFPPLIMPRCSWPGEVPGRQQWGNQQTSTNYAASTPLHRGFQQQFAHKTT